MVEEILKERKNTHGQFHDQALVAQRLKCAANDGIIICNTELTDVEKEAIDMILHKIARVIAGDPHFEDHWSDIAGYATLVPIHNKAGKEKWQ